MNGIIVKAIQQKGQFFILGEDGKEYFAHHTELLQKQKYYRQNSNVSFTPQANEGGKRPRASGVTVEIPEEYSYPHSGHGRWQQTKVKGRVRCSDCGSETEAFNLPYCTHCGAVMQTSNETREEAMARDNSENIQMRKDCIEPTSQWIRNRYGRYFCENCMSASPSNYPTIFCGHCGKLKRKPTRNG